MTLVVTSREVPAVSELHQTASYVTDRAFMCGHGIARLTYRAQLQSEYTLNPTVTHHTSDIIKVWTAVLYLRRLGAVARSLPC